MFYQTRELLLKTGGRRYLRGLLFGSIRIVAQSDEPLQEFYGEDLGSIFIAFHFYCIPFLLHSIFIAFHFHSISRMSKVPMASLVVQDTALTILANICGYFSNKTAIVTRFNALERGIIKEDDFLFFLKGGMAYEILRQDKFPLDIDPRAGNDFDTILLINPQLEPAVFDTLKTMLQTDIHTECEIIVRDPGLQDTISYNFTSRKIPTGSKFSKPLLVTDPHEIYEGATSMNINLISIFLNTKLIPGPDEIYTKLIDISIPHRHYNLLPFDYALYSIPGRVISKAINGHTIFIADFLSILFDQSVTNKLNAYATQNKKERRAARIQNLKTRTTKTNRNAIINAITPYLNNGVLNGFVANDVVTGYKKEITKVPAILPSSSSSSSSSSAPLIIVAAHPPKAKEEPISPLQVAVLKRMAEFKAAKVAEAAAKGTT